MGITFVPQFVHEPKEEAAVEHLLRHIDHVCNWVVADSYIRFRF